MQNLLSATVFALFMLTQIVAGLDGREPYGERLLRMISCNYNIHDGSRGDVKLPEMDDLLNKYGINDDVVKEYHTLTTLNHVYNITYLLEEALDNDNDGDAVYLYHKFLYAGSNDTTKLNGDLPLVQDIREIVRNLVAEGEKGLQKLDRLKYSTAVPVISRLYSTENIEEVEKADKRTWTETRCDTRHTAPRSRCRLLINAISSDWSTKSGGPRHLEYNGCFVSWSRDLTFTVNMLAPAANQCMRSCDNAQISCLVRNVLLSSTYVTQCLSGRATNCR